MLSSNSGAQLGGEGGRPPLPFFKIVKSALIWGKKARDSVYFWVEYSIQNVVLRVPRRKGSKIFLFSCVFNKIFIEVP